MEGNPSPEGIVVHEVHQVKSLGDILNTQLNVENINTYAEDAIRDLIRFTNKTVTDYQKTNSTNGLSDKEIEDQAFKNYGIENIGSILDHIHTKAQEIKDLDQVVSRVKRNNQVVVETDKTKQPNFSNGDGEYQEARTTDRLKSILFVLMEDFDVDVNNPDQITIQDGILRDDMMRKQSYYLLQVPKIDRTILVCNEVGNITYVFNSKELQQSEISDQQIINSTKPELNQLIENNPQLGRSVIYSKNGFIPRVIDAIQNPINTIPDELSPRMENTARYLTPKSPEGYLSNFGIAKKLDIAEKTVIKIINQIDPEKLGEIKRYMFRRKFVPGYSPQQIEIIKNQLQELGYLNSPPEGYLPNVGIARELSVNPQIVIKIINQIDPEKFGEVGRYMFGSKFVPGYSSQQIEIIKNQLQELGYLNSPPEGYLPNVGIAHELGVSRQTITKIINQIDPKKFGEIKTYEFHSQFVPGYSPKQIEMIREQGEKQNYFIDNHPEDYLSNVGIAQKLGIDRETVTKIINQIDPEKFGEIKKHKFHGQIALSYSPQQQQMILDYINSHKR